MPDYWAFLRRWVEERGPAAPLYSLGFDFLFSIPGAGRSRAVSARSPPIAVSLGRSYSAACRSSCTRGDDDDYRPWTERHRVDLRGRTGFVRLALREQVPVVPLVAHGSHDVIIVVARGGAFARRVGLDRLRISVFPVMLGPAGILPLQLTWPPPPAKVTCVRADRLDASRSRRPTTRSSYAIAMRRRLDACSRTWTSSSPHARTRSGAGSPPSHSTGSSARDQR